MVKENVDPNEFSFQSPITREILLNLAKTNSDINKQCFWLPSQAFSNGITYENDKPWESNKFGDPYTFDTFFEYMQWTGTWEELEKSISYSCLFGICTTVGLNDSNITKYKGKDYFGPTDKPATEIKAFYPVTNGSGYWIEKYDDDGEPEIYKIQITNKSFEIESSLQPKNAIVVYYVHASRTVRFPSLQIDLSLAGTPKTYLTAHMAIAKQILVESVVNAAKNMSAGTLVRRVVNETEMETLEAVNTTPSYKNRIYIIGGTESLDEKIKVYVPDLKSTQFVDFTRSINKYLASASNLSLRVYGEEDIASGLGEGAVKFSTNLLQAEIKDIQSHYHKPIEHVFHLLGKENTEYKWNIPQQLMDVKDNDRPDKQRNSTTEGSPSGDPTNPTE